MSRRFLLRSLSVVFWIAFGLGHAQTAIDLDGHAVDPLAASPGKSVVLVYLRRDCPISGRYAPVIKQISQRYAADASFWLVYPDPRETPETIRKSLHDFGYHLPALRDAQRVLVKLGHVQITPEVAVFNRYHKLIYDGRIDDSYIDVARTRPAPTTHELEDAIEAALAGHRVARDEIRGVGCYISDVE